jgi:hypothetical protein
MRPLAVLPVSPPALGAVTKHCLFFVKKINSDGDKGGGGTMSTRRAKDQIRDWVQTAFSDLGPDGNTIIQNYISLLIQRIEHLETVIQRSAFSIIVAVFAFILVRDGVVNEIELSGTKIVNLKFVLPFFPVYLGYVFYTFSTSLANAASLERVAQRCYDKLAPNLNKTPLDTIFMIRTFFGTENHDLGRDHNSLEKTLNHAMLIFIILFWAFGFLAIMLFVCHSVVSGAYFPPLYTWLLVGCGGVMAARAYVYFYTYMSL